ncbi:MAG: hypothetical protein ACAI34_15410 [Verrucomicrobium sp.]
MNAQFLSGSDYRARGGGGNYNAKKSKDSGLFWWTILITLLLGLATFCWFFSIMVFKYPEKPFNYKLLTKLQKLDPLKKFDPLLIPRGNFLGPRDLLKKYYDYNPEQLKLVNDLLKRSYILNYNEESPVYVKGAYTVIGSRPLTKSDFVDAGWIVRARSTELEDVELELIFPGSTGEAAPYHEGDSIALDNKNTFGSVLNVQRNYATDGLCATVVPIAYGEFAVGDQQILTLVPPEVLNVEAVLPITTFEEVGAGATPRVAAQSGLK